jgi:hypothetical protein
MAGGRREGVVSVPLWLEQLRRSLVVDVVQRDPRTQGQHLFGVRRDRVFSEVIGGGQADFDERWVDPTHPAVVLTGDDRALLYAWFNLPAHLVELARAMEMLTASSTRMSEPVVIDLGCGPGTGGLAMAHALGPEASFVYVGVDRAASMRRLGERMMSGAAACGRLGPVNRVWAASAGEVGWEEAPGWRPVVVLCSYLLASPTLDPILLVEEVMKLVDRIGRGPVVVLYTNSVRDRANLHLPAFCGALAGVGFTSVENKFGRVSHNGKARVLRYALFVRKARTTLALG